MTTTAQIREKLDEMFGYSGEEAQKLSEVLAKSGNELVSRIPKDYEYLMTRWISPGVQILVGYANNCTFYGEYDANKKQITIVLGGQPENRKKAKRTLAEIGGITIKE